MGWAVNVTVPELPDLGEAIWAVMPVGTDVVLSVTALESPAGCVTVTVTGAGVPSCNTVTVLAESCTPSGAAGIDADPLPPAHMVTTEMKARQEIRKVTPNARITQPPEGATPHAGAYSENPPEARDIAPTGWAHLGSELFDIVQPVLFRAGQLAILTVVHELGDRVGFHREC